MARVVIAAPADQDTADILADLALNAGLRVAERYLTRFERLYERLSVHPESCQARPELGQHIRVCVSAPYLVFYNYEGDASHNDVVVLRILHGSRRIGSELIDTPE